MAARLDTAVMLTETATLPRPSQVMMLENEPPGQDATRIMPSASSASTSNHQVVRQVAAGNNTNCASSPTMGASGRCTTRRKSSPVRDSDTPNIMNARITLRISRFSLPKCTSISHPLLQLGDVGINRLAVAILMHVVRHACQFQIVKSTIQIA